MTRTGLVVALVIGALAGLTFGLFPELDLAVSRLFAPEGTFTLGADPVLNFVRHAGMVIVGLLVAPAGLALVLKLARPRRPLLVRGRAIVFLFSTLLLGPLLATNIVLKDHWGRPRPRDVIAFGGAQPFLPWWDPRGRCPANCSFVAGEAAGAFWTVAPASLAPPPWRPLAYAGALTFGAVIGLLRVSFGGHFLSDVVFAGVITFVIVWLVHGWLYRWRRTRLTDEAVEQAIERFALALRRPFAAAASGRLAGRRAEAGPDRQG
ncbi:MAG: phosphatase PAP2 family protein [Variibacter sp.]|nr:phosphatase PAP2 family protein [Variibacter sp.]